MGGYLAVDQIAWAGGVRYLNVSAPDTPHPLFIYFRVVQAIDYRFLLIDFIYFLIFNFVYLAYTTLTCSRVSNLYYG